jgi:calcineurin-like phosphoesterase family protein
VKRSLSVAGVAFLAGTTLLGGACGGKSSSASLGSASVGLALADGTSLSSASYTIVGPAAFTASGVINVGSSTTLTAVVGGLPAGVGYSISIAATTVGGADTCAGSTSFAVTAGATTAVNVHLTCHEALQAGSVSVNGTINICPTLGGITALPGEAVVGGSVSLAVSASDADNGPAPLAYHWTASSGTLDDADVATPTFTCVFPGPVTLTVAASDGDPSTACTATGNVQITCSAAPPSTYAWIVLGSGGTPIARVITPEPACPSITIDGVSHPMALRAAAATVAQRTTASPAAMSKPSAFPVTSCEYALPPGAQTVVAAGVALPLPKAAANRIVVIGDTGCRLKQGNPWQACSDPTQWPLQEVATNAAALKPDLVLHVGDYQYRENPCPSDVAGCQGSPWGYGWDTWEADLFKPAQALLGAAPWIMVRGNHEQCMRAGQGWYRFLDTQPYTATKTCDDPTNDNTGNYNPPYAVPIGGSAQVIVFDSSNVGANPLSPSSSAADALMFDNYAAQLITVASLAEDPSVFSIFTNHHPLLAYTSVAGSSPTGGNPALLSVMAALYPGSYFPPNIKMVLEGHNHIFEAIDYATPHPVSILSGNGGDNLDLDLPDPFPLGPTDSGGDEPAPGVIADRIADMSSFGYLSLDRTAKGWTMTEYLHDGTVMDTCAIDAGTDKITCDKYGFLH